LWRKDYVERREVIRRSYEKAISNGDKNVYFIDGETLFSGECIDACTVDNCHPNDLGHMRMGKRIGDVIEKVLCK
jgi:lysophospholipase L1-like esterase